MEIYGSKAIYEIFLTIKEGSPGKETVTGTVAGDDEGGTEEEDSSRPGHGTYVGLRTGS